MTQPYPTEPTATDELTTMLRIAKILDRLDPAMQDRAVCWLYDRYHPISDAQHYAEDPQR